MLTRFARATQPMIIPATSRRTLDPLHALADREELADAMGRLADRCTQIAR